MTTGADLMLRVSKLPEWAGTDAELVRLALRHYRTLCRNFIYGGLGHEHALAVKAAEAFERIQRPMLPGMEAG